MFSRTIVAATGCTAALGMSAALAVVGAPATADSDVTVTVSIPEAGALGISVAAEDLALGAATVAADRSAWEASGALPTVTVTDTRVTRPGWELTAQLTPFTAAPDRELTGASLQVSPTLAEDTTVEAATPSELVGATDGVRLVHAAPDRGDGENVVDGDVAFRAPLESEPGEYAAVLTLTVS